MSEAGPTLLLYSHNVYGLGHIARTLCIAEATLDVAPCHVIVVTGCRALDSLRRDPRIELERLEPAAVSPSGLLVAACDAGDSGVLARRTRRLLEYCRALQPAVMLVDNEPFGLGGELVDTLVAASEEEWPTRFVFGLPYPRNSSDPQSGDRRFRNPRLLRAIRHYESVIGYSDPLLFDALTNLAALGLEAPSAPVGFVARTPVSTEPIEPPVIAVIAGGGIAGAAMFETIAAAFAQAELAPAARLRLVVGPLGDLAAARALARTHANIDVWPEADVEDAMAGARVVVARPGYNSAFTIIQSTLPVIFVAMPTPDGEQVVRAAQLATLPRVWSVAEGDAAAMCGALEAAFRTPPQSRPLPFRMDGARRAALWLLDRREEALA